LPKDAKSSLGKVDFIRLVKACVVVPMTVSGLCKAVYVEWRQETIGCETVCGMGASSARDGRLPTRLHRLVTTLDHRVTHRLFALRAAELEEGLRIASILGSIRRRATGTIRHDYDYPRRAKEGSAMFNHRCKPARLVWAGMLLGLFPGRAALAADPLMLTARVKPGDLTQVTIRMEVGGELSVNQDGKPVPLKMSVAADLSYRERLLELGGNRLRSLRYYDQAEAVIKIEEGGVKPILRDDRRLIGVESATDATTTMFSPRGLLTREELDLIEVPANTLWIDALLPTVPVAPGEKWVQSEAVWAALLRLDAVNATDVESTLEELEPGSEARATMAGQVDGAVDGVATSIEVKGRYTFDVKLGRVTSLTLLIKEKRAPGLTGPGVDVVAKVVVSVAPLAKAPELMDDALTGLPLEASRADQRLSYQFATAPIRLAMDRRWQVMEEKDRLTALRLIDSGQLLAQCNVAVPDPMAGKRLTLPQFQAEIRKAIGENFGKFTQATTARHPAGYTQYRVVAVGTVNELPIQWTYYLVADDEGRQVMLAFTFEQESGDRFADADLPLVESIELLKATPQTAARPTPAKP
jgi:hypothetical protein